MIYSVEGILEVKREAFIVVNIGDISLRITPTAGVIAALPEVGQRVKLFTHLHVREDILALYGFANVQEMDLFQNLTSISGVGPKSAIGILNVSKVDQLIAAINEGRTELITRVSGVGKKTAERIVLELKGKLASLTTQQTLTLMESDLELVETLVGLGYTKADAKKIVEKINPKITGFKERLKAALKKPKTSS
jgi:holliday junction DNA helicase RuvA